LRGNGREGDTWSQQCPVGPTLGQVNNEWAIEQLQKFIAGAQHVRQPGGYGRHALPEEQVVAQAQVIEQIFARVIPDWRDQVKDRLHDFDTWQRYRDVAHRAVAQLEREQEIAENLGETAPDLNAAQMHTWVWDGARSLWASGHFREAVSAAAVKVNAETQNRVNRYDISEVKLFQEVLSPRDPQPEKPRLRLMPDNGSETYKSFQEGAIAFATGCYRAIRNPPAHVPGELPEAEALEQLAAFSVLARWIDAAVLDEA
jgi:Protein of unknown function (Hypoth_ymh)